jgi:hypothetical protein
MGVALELIRDVVASGEVLQQPAVAAGGEEPGGR